MLHIFQYDEECGQVRLARDELLLIREFAALMDIGRNKCRQDPSGHKRLRAFREFTYIWLAIDWESLYKDYSILERHQEALSDAGLSDEEWNDSLFRAACRKYRDILESSRAIRILNASRVMVDKFIDYFENIDPLERDEQTGKPIWKVKDIQIEILNLPKVLDELKEVEQKVKREMAETSVLRAGAVEGFTPIGF